MSRRKSTHVPRLDPDVDPLKLSSGDESSSRSTRSRRKSSASSSTGKHSLSENKPNPIEESSEADDELMEAEQEEVESVVAPPRRSLRHRSPNKRYTEGFVNTRSRGGRRQRTEQTSDEDNNNGDQQEEQSEDDEWQMDQLVGKVKATTLFEERLDVAGQKVFGFRTPRKRGSMNVLAASSAHRTPTTGRKSVSKLAAVTTPKTPKTPSSTAGRRKSKVDLAKTPHRERTKLKRSIKKMVQDDSGSDFTVSDSDYVPSSEEDEDDDNDEDEENKEDDEDEEVEEIKPKRPIIRNQLASIEPALVKAESSTPASALRVSSRIQNRRKANLDYVLKSDDYFSSHSSSKVVTSDSTLDRLKTPRLPHDQLFRLLKELQGSTEHQKAIKKLHDEYDSYFAKWLLLMNEGYNILLYGLGSKRNLLQSFHSKVLADKPVIVVNGFFPTLTIKDILEAITGDILDLNVHSANFHELVDIIEEEFSYLPDTHLFLIVHNLDGTMLRNNKAQNILARLAKIDNIHLLASIDHINTPLVWDSSKLSYYNFSWWDVTTMLPYSDETAFENSLLVQNSGALALSSMKNVFQSLTSNSRGIFLAIVRYQLANKGNPHYPGMLFKELYSACREAFLVSSDLALRAQLTEFIDHKLVRMKRTVDGAENLLIPIEHGLLQQFVEENEES